MLDCPCSVLWLESRLWLGLFVSAPIGISWLSLSSALSLGDMKQKQNLGNSLWSYVPWPVYLFSSVFRISLCLIYIYILSRVLSFTQGKVYLTDLSKSRRQSTLSFIIIFVTYIILAMIHSVYTVL